MNTDTAKLKLKKSVSIRQQKARACP